MPGAALYARMEANLIESWARYATGSPGGFVQRFAAASVAVFPEEPERAVYNNAVLVRGLDVRAAMDALARLEALYADASVDRYAVWAHDREAATLDALERRGYRFDTSTRAMAMTLDGLRPASTDAEIRPVSWREYVDRLERFEMPAGLLRNAEPDDFHVSVADVDGETVAAAVAFDYAGDCGIYNVTTLPHARRRGLATALAARQLREARERGCTTASLQATQMAEGIYRAVGFKDLGRFVEYVRAPGSPRHAPPSAR
jgi:ribosomal protein S18 acetylase RimI-like enzyme